MRIGLALLAAGSLGLLPPGAQAAGGEERIAVIVGANLGDGDDEPLRYAEKDARRIRRILVDLGGVRADRALLGIGGDAATVLIALREARGRAAELSASGKRVAFFFYYSGHGDDRALHLPGGNLSLQRLRRAIAEIPAELRISVLDACRTARVSKGISRGPSFSLAVAPDAPRGTVELRASSAGEPAQESNELAGSLFSHYLASGLRGAADGDGDGRVTLAEAYAHVYRRTLARSVRGGSLQHPSLAMKTEGAGELVVTRPGKASAALEVPGGAERYLVFDARTSAVMGELSGEDRARLALPPGRFVIARRRGPRTSVAEVELSWGGTKKLSSSDFRPIAREELALRGGAIELNPRSVQPQAGLELCFGCAEGLALRAGLGLAYVRGAWVLGLEASYLRGGLETAAYDGDQEGIVGGPYVGWRWFPGPVTLVALVGVELRYAWQQLTRHDAERARAAGLEHSEARTAGGLGPRLGLGLSLPVARQLTITAAVAGSALVRRESDGKESTIKVRGVFSPTVGLGYAF